MIQPPLSSYICTAEQSRRADEATIEQFGIDGFTLMEVAGSSAAKKMLQQLDRDARGVFLCGKGNNAGDALVVARYLVQRGMDAHLAFISGSGDLSPDTAKNLKLLKKISDNDRNAGTLAIDESWEAFDRDTPCDFIVDGMLGTGLESELRGDYLPAAEWCNASAAPVFAMDIPTGLHSDTGRKMGGSVSATVTYAFGMLKQGYYLNEGPGCTGTVEFCELPFPNYVKECSTYLIDSSWVKPNPRAPSRHKYEAGVLFIVAGSEGLTGAALLAAQSAWAEGLGAVILVCPRGILPVFENNLPQVIKKPVGTREDFHFRQAHAEEVRAILDEKDGKLLLGPGLGRAAGTEDFVHDLLSTLDKDSLIDADALWALSRRPEWQKPESPGWILTPHPGELQQLAGKDVTDDYARLETAGNFCGEKGITLLSKGYPAIVGTKSGETYLTGYDTRAFARAGFGDVLAGKIAAYFALGHEEASSVLLGLLNGKHKLDNLHNKHPEKRAHYPEPRDLI